MAVKSSRSIAVFVAKIDRKIADLTALRTELDRAIGSCRRGTVADRKIIDALGTRPQRQSSAHGPRSLCPR